MKPYLAILYDSFLESISSRVLWILLAGWTLILLALFPLSLSEGESYQLRTSDISSPKTVLDQLASASAGRGTRAQRSVYSKIDEEFQDVLKERQKNGRKILVGRLVSALNRAIESPDLYDKQAWPTAERREELKELIDRENKSPEQLQKLNRRLLDLAFPNSIKSSAGQATWVTYAGLRFTDPLPFTLRQIRPVIESTLLPLVMWIGLGQVAMMIAIVITSPMIPDMFQTGSLHLLLSKPLSRSLLFLSKYIGGCIFVAINIAFLIVGLYFYSGIQLGIWNRGILLCIPLFVFAFMIFYSVSALVGLIWKNPIICVVVTALFWGACFTVGIVRGLSEGFLRGPPTLQQIVVVGETPIVANQQGRIQFWNEANRQWQTAFGDVNGQRVIGPIWREADSTLYFGRPPFIPFGFTTGDSIRLELARLPELGSSHDAAKKSKEEGNASEDASGPNPARKLWEDSRLDSGPDLPADSSELLPWKDSFVAVTPDGLFLFDPAAAAKSEQSKVTVFGFDMKIPQAEEAYKRLTEADWGLRRPLAVALSEPRNECIICSRGKLMKFHFDNSKLVLDKEITLDIPAETVANLAVQGSLAVICPNAFEPIVVDLDTMQVVQTLTEVGKTTTKRIAVDHTGRVGLLTTDGDVFILSSHKDAAKPGFESVRPNLVGQGDASTISFDSQNRLWIAHHVKQVDVWDTSLKSSIQSFRPRSTVPELLFNYLINPFYLINPKPSAINETIQYVLRNPDNKVNAIDRTDLDIPQVARDPWQPIWSNGIFIAVMLVVGCWYLYRQDL